MVGRIFTGFAWAGFFFWSLLCLGGWAVIALGGDVLRWIAGAAFAPGTGGTVASVLTFIEAFGTIVLTWIWIAGSVLILVVGTILRRAAANATVIRFEQRAAGYAQADPAQMKDVTPPYEPPPAEIKRLPPR
jgi:hypothetical protein